MGFNINRLVLGSKSALELEHRCYNGVCLAAGLGCLAAAGFNTAIGMSTVATLANITIGTIYLWLYFQSRQQTEYKPTLWLYILSGTFLLGFTWFYNGGIGGSDTFVAMVALVALTVVLKKNRWKVAFFIFFPAISLFFLIEYYYPDLVTRYKTSEQQFLDMYIAFTVSTFVVFYILSLILRSHGNEKTQLKKTNHMLEEKMEMLNQANQALEEALGQVRTLTGLLPICATCKKIRDDQGYWKQIESYLQEHSQAILSHGICPDCADDLYGDEDWYKKRRK
ncbi:MAG: hypothetical protein MI892_02695 [Desulfobacterales bacterium]|nr:hypothetical protein [Desulfobacterales bacterium]